MAQYPVLDLSTWGTAKVEDGGRTVRVYDKLGTSVFAYRHLIAVPEGTPPYQVFDKDGVKVKDVFSDQSQLLPYQELRKSSVAIDLTWTVEGGKLNAVLPQISSPVQLYDATDTGSVNTADAHIRADADFGDGSAGYMLVADQSPDIWRSLIRFTLSSGSGAISDVKLYLYRRGTYGAGAWNVEAHQLTQTAWTEAGVKWTKYDGSNNWTTGGGDFSSTVVDALSHDNGANTWRAWGLYGSTADNPISGLNWGDSVNLILKASTETGGLGGQYEFYSTKETGSDEPYIEIQYTTSLRPSAPTDLLTNDETNPTGVTTSTPKFSAVYRDPDSGDQAVFYRLQVSASSTNWSSLMWDSGKTAMATTTVDTRSPDIYYDGSPLFGDENNFQQTSLLSLSDSKSLSPLASLTDDRSAINDSGLVSGKQRFAWQSHPELEDRSKRTHTTKDFQDPNDPTKRNTRQHLSALLRVRTHPDPWLRAACNESEGPCSCGAGDHFSVLC